MMALVRVVRSRRCVGSGKSRAVTTIDSRNLLRIVELLSVMVSCSYGLLEGWWSPKLERLRGLLG